MNQNLQKQAKIKLGRREYEELRERMLQRDNWRCQGCGSMTNLEVHHQQFRCHSGPDHEDNLITLCAGCHSSVHLRRKIPRLASSMAAKTLVKGNSSD